MADFLDAKTISKLRLRVTARLSFRLKKLAREERDERESSESRI